MVQNYEGAFVDIMARRPGDGSRIQRNSGLKPRAKLHESPLLLCVSTNKAHDQIS